MTGDSGNFQRRTRPDNEARFPVGNNGAQDDTTGTRTQSQEVEDLHVHVSNFTARGEEKSKRINNPFHGWMRIDVERMAKQLAQWYGAPEDVFVRAAIVLFKPVPELWNNRVIPGLEDDEITSLIEEKKTGFLAQPLPLRTTFFVLFVAAVVQGWNQTGTTGANLGWPQELLFNSEPVDPTRPDRSLNQNCVPGGHNKWIFAAVNAMPYLAASMGTFLSDSLNEVFFGRRNAILISALIIFAASIGSAFATEWKSLLGLRAILGIGMGCKAAVVPVFAAEIAPAHLRGTLVMNWQVFDALGIFLGYSANMILSKTSSSWRWQLASSCIPTFALICGVLFVRWDSPRFLMKREQQNRAWHNKVLSAWRAAQENLTARYPDQQDITPVTSQLIVIPDWFYVHLPGILREHFRPITTNEYSSPAYETLLSLRKAPILAAKELIFAHCQLLTEIYTYPPVNSNNPSSSSELQELHSNPSSQVQPVPASIPSSAVTPGATIEDSAVHESVSDPANTIDQNYTSNTVNFDPRVDENDRVDIVLTGRTRLLARMGHVSNRDMRYLARGLVAASVVMISQQLCGINVLIFYSASMFCNPDQQGSGSLQPLLLSWGIGLTNVVFSLPAYRWIETKGRQWLMLATLPLLSVLIAAAASSFQAPQGTVQQALVGTFAYAFTAVYSFGMGPVPFTYSAEIFPLEHRIIGMSWAVSVNFLGAGILAFFVPVLQIGSILLGVFAGLNLCAFVAVWKWVPETISAVPSQSGETHMTALDLSQLFYIFRRENWIHQRYMSDVYFTYFWASVRAVFTRKDVEQPDPFHDWNRHWDKKDPRDEDHI